MVKARVLWTVGIVALAGSVAGVLAAQTPATPATPAFETVSIKQGQGYSYDLPLMTPWQTIASPLSMVLPRPPTRTASFQSGGRFTAVNASLYTLLDAAYRGASPPLVGPAFKVLGGPDWTRTDSFDIGATAPGDPPLDQMELMLRTLLTQRFALKAHEETRKLPAYKLVMARKDRKLGPQIRPSACVNMSTSVSPDPSGLPRCLDRFASHYEGGRLVVAATTMDQLAVVLGSFLRTAVYNQTGLAGTFDVVMESDTEGLSRAPVFDGDSLPEATRPLTAVPHGPGIGWSNSMFDVMPQQLGLKLESTKGPVDVLVIDHVEHPTTSSGPVTVPPTLVITAPSVLDAGAPVTIIVTAANLPAGNMIQTLLVSDGAGSTRTFVPAGSFSTVVFIYQFAGTYTVMGTFTDALGNTESASLSVTVH